MTHDTQVLLIIGVTAIAGYVLYGFVIAPVWEYISELREYRAGKWRGEWSESRRLDILRYSRDEAIYYPVSLCLLAFVVGVIVQLLRILGGAEGELGTLALLVVGVIVSYRIAARFNPHEE